MPTIKALEWDNIGERIYETGDKNVALYVYQDTATTPTGASGYTTHYSSGVAWNGITAITESPSGAEATDLWADDTKYATLRSAEQFGGTIEAYTYPDEWELCDGSITVGGVKLGQQKRKAFGLAFITTVGNDTEQNDHGEKLHLIYGATASPAERSYATINDSPEAITFSWEFTTTPIKIGSFNGVDYKDVSCMTIEYNEQKTTEFKEKYLAFKQLVFGRSDNGGIQGIQAHLPEPQAVLAYFNTQNSLYEYVLTDSEPTDWDTKFMYYYTKDANNQYHQIGDLATPPTWAENTYYERVYDND